MAFVLALMMSFATANCELSFRAIFDGDRVYSTPAIDDFASLRLKICGIGKPSTMGKMYSVPNDAVSEKTAVRWLRFEVCC